MILFWGFFHLIGGFCGSGLVFWWVFCSVFKIYYLFYLQLKRFGRPSTLSHYAESDIQGPVLAEVSMQVSNKTWQQHSDALNSSLETFTEMERALPEQPEIRSLSLPVYQFHHSCSRNKKNPFLWYKVKTQQLLHTVLTPIHKETKML